MDGVESWIEFSVDHIRQVSSDLLSVAQIQSAEVPTGPRVSRVRRLLGGDALVSFR